MSAVVALHSGISMPAERKERSAWDLAADAARQVAMARSVLVRQVQERINRGFSRRMAINSLLSEIRLGSCRQAVDAVGKAPSYPTLNRWVDAYASDGNEGLLTGYTGRVRKDYGWELRAQALFADPTGRGYATVAFKLRQAGWESATNKRVERYLKSLPSNQAETNPKRMGKHYYGQNVKPYVIRDISMLPVGMVYQGDGHCCDVYVQHPVKGHFRPELTVWIDVASHYVVGWWISESESAQTTLFSLSYAFRRHDHVPAFVHTDPGSGFKARMISEEAVGFLDRMSIDPILALPGNAKGKGLVEGWFRWFEERCGKDFDTFCGHCRTDDALQRMETRIRRGELRLPSFPEYLDAIRSYVEAYNNNPNDGLDGAIPAQLWAALERVPVEHEGVALIRPRKFCSVRRWRVQLDNRIYQHADLQAYEGLRGSNNRKVQVEYCLHDDSRVWIHDDKGRFICEAPLVEKKEWLPLSRIEEGQQRRLEGQRKRLQRKIDEAEARSHSPISAADVIGALHFDSPTQLIAQGDLLDGGHSVALPPAPPSAPRDTTVSAEAIRRVAATIASDERPKETPKQRFALALELETTIERGEAVSDELFDWLQSYTDTSEYRGYRRLFNEFGAV